MINKDKFLEILGYVASRQAEIEISRKSRPHVIAGLCILVLSLFLSLRYFLLISILTIIMSFVVNNYYSKKIKNDMINLMLDCAEKWNNNLDNNGLMTDKEAGLNIFMDSLYTIMNYKFVS